MKTLVVEWQRLLDERNQTCPRCGTTEQEVEKAAKELNRKLAFSGVVVSLVKKAVDQESFNKDALQSNRILIAGKTMEEWLGARTGQSKCCDVCGDAECRTIEYADETHEAIPAELIVTAGLIAAAHVFQVELPHTGQKMPLLKIKTKKA